MTPLILSAKNAASPPNPEPSTSLATHRGAVVILNGLPAVGKLTIGRELHKLINATDEPLKDLGSRSTFFHNHLLLDAALALVKWADPEHIKLRQRLVSIATDCMKSNPEPERIFIITANLSRDVERERPAECQEYIEVAKHRNLRMLWVNLTCNSREHERRLQDPTRRDTKSNDVSALNSDRRNPSRVLLTPDDDLVDIDDVTCTLQLQDTSGLTPQQSAREIFNTLQMQLRN